MVESLCVRACVCVCCVFVGGWGEGGMIQRAEGTLTLFGCRCCTFGQFRQTTQCL